MSKTLKDKVSQAMEEVGARVRDFARSIGLLPHQPRLVPIPVPPPQVRKRSKRFPS